MIKLIKTNKKRWAKSIKMLKNIAKQNPLTKYNLFHLI